MGENKDTRQQLIDRINKKRKVLTGIGVTGAIIAALSVPATIGVGVSVIANDIAANSEFEKIRASVSGTTAYESFVDDKRQQLKEAFYNGEISYADFKSQYESLVYVDTVREFAETTDNEILKKQFAVADEYTKVSEDSLKYDLIGCSLGGAAGGVSFAIADAIDKKYKHDLRNLGVEEKELTD